VDDPLHCQERWARDEVDSAFEPNETGGLVIIRDCKMGPGVAEPQRRAGCIVGRAGGGDGVCLDSRCEETEEGEEEDEEGDGGAEDGRLHCE
jgi:hypothetical protein